MPDMASVEKFLASLESDSSKVLGITVGSKVVTPGLFIPKAEATVEPVISFKGTGSYIIACIDPDAPFTSFAFLGPILHWLQSGVKPEGPEDALKAADTPAIARWAGPGPPSISSPHRYIFLLYQEPAGFDYKKYALADGKDYSISKRMRYDLAAFEKDAKLGPVIAANFFTSK